MSLKQEISIWFFIGIALVVNGFLITAAGLYEWFVQPPESPVVLYSLHANVWWGIFLLIAGVFYCWKFAPARGKTEPIAANVEECEEIHAK